MLLFGKCVPFWGSMRWHFVNWLAVYHLKQYAHCSLCIVSIRVRSKYKNSHFPALISHVDGRWDLRELYHNGTVVSWLKKRERDKYSWNIDFAAAWNISHRTAGTLIIEMQIFMSANSDLSKICKRSESRKTIYVPRTRARIESKIFLFHNAIKIVWNIFPFPLHPLSARRVLFAVVWYAARASNFARCFPGNV